MLIAMLRWFLAFVGTCAICTAQTEKTPHFEAVSIKPVSSDVRMGSTGGPGTDDPGRVTINRCSVRLLIEATYGMLARVSGPAWMDSEYAITAIMPLGATRPEYVEMMKNLLAERFGLTFHIVGKEATAYELVVSKGGLVVSKGGPKGLTPSEPSDAPAKEDPWRPGPDANGFPLLLPGLHWRALYQDGELFMTFREASMDYLADTLSRELSKNSIRVTDATGLPGKFDFHFRCLRSPQGGPRPDQPPIVEDMRLISSELERQLGLALRPVKATIDTLVVDHLLRTPTEN
jgi:uncharacterized protein (TIGR03435 family)